MVTAATQKVPVRIELLWPPHSSATQYEISRRTSVDAPWTPLASITTTAGEATGWTDLSVKPATVYEYQVRRLVDGGRGASGFTLSAIERPLMDARGTLILVVDSRLRPPYLFRSLSTRPGSVTACRRAHGEAQNATVRRIETGKGLSEAGAGAQQ